MFLAALRWAAFYAGNEQGLYVIVGSPMRRGHDGEPQQHLAVWHLDADFAKACAARFPNLTTPKR